MRSNSNDPFYSANSTLLHAKKRRAELDRQIDKFLKKAKCVRIIEEDFVNLRTVHSVSFTHQIPTICDHLASEVLFHLRSTLDRIAFTAAWVSGNQRLKKTQFPISENLVELDNLIEGRKVCKDVPPTIVDLFRKFKPYRDGNSAI